MWLWPSHTPPLQDSCWNNERGGPLWGCPCLGCAECWSQTVAVPGTTVWFFHWYSSSFPSTEALCDLYPGWILYPGGSTGTNRGPTWWPVPPFPRLNTEPPWGTVSDWRRPLDGGHLDIQTPVWSICLQDKMFIKVWTVQHGFLTQWLLDVMESSHWTWLGHRDPVRSVSRAALVKNCGMKQWCPENWLELLFLVWISPENILQPFKELHIVTIRERSRNVTRTSSTPAGTLSERSGNVLFLAGPWCPKGCQLLGPLREWNLPVILGHILWSSILLFPAIQAGHQLLVLDRNQTEKLNSGTWSQCRILCCYSSSAPGPLGYTTCFSMNLRDSIRSTSFFSDSIRHITKSSHGSTFSNVIFNNICPPRLLLKHFRFTNWSHLKLFVFWEVAGVTVHTRWPHAPAGGKYCLSTSSSSNTPLMSITFLSGRCTHSFNRFICSTLLERGCPGVGTWYVGGPSFIRISNRHCHFANGLLVQNWKMFFVFCKFVFFISHLGQTDRTVDRQEAELKCKKIQNKSQAKVK